MTVQDTLKNLLFDPNVPDQLVKEVINEFFISLKNGDDQNLHDDLFRIVRLNQRKYLFAGPTLSLSKKTARVSKIVRSATLVRYYLFYTGMLYSRDSEEEILYHIQEGNININKIIQKIHSGNANWVTLESEIKGLNVDEIISGLGINGYQSSSENYFKLSYDLNTEFLRVPTVLDAGLFPMFIPKPKGNKNFSKAWDWQKNDWGLSEFVHPNIDKPQNLTLEYLGSSSINCIDSFRSYSIPVSSSLERFVYKLLTQLTAHKELEPFIEGNENLITISPRRFEEFVSNLYQRNGFTTTITKFSRDGGYDIIALRDIKSNEGLLIQVKKTKNTIGIRLIRELIGAKFLAPDEYSKYMLAFVTTSKFSRDVTKAKDKQLLEIDLIDYKSIQKQLNQLRNMGITDILEKVVDERNNF